MYIIWRPKKEPSPFITETATRIFRSVDEAIDYFEQSGLVTSGTLFGN